MRNKLKYSKEVWENKYFYLFAGAWFLFGGITQGIAPLSDPMFYGQVLGSFFVSLIVFTIRYFIIRRKK